MRIAVFIKSTTFHKGHGGLETQNKLLCEGLVGREHDITVFSQKKELDIESAVLEGVKYIFIPCSYRYLFSSINQNSWLNKSYKLFKAEYAKKPFDLVLGQSSGAVGIIAHANDLDVRVVSISHGTTLSEFKTSLYNAHGWRDYILLIKNLQYVLRQFFGRQRDVILNSKKVVAVSNAVKNALIDETYVPEDRVVVINNGIDPKMFSTTNVALKRDFSQKTVLYVGQISKDKGVDFLVDVFLNELTQYKLTLVGGGPLLPILKKKVEDAGQQERIKLLGKVLYEKIYTFYTDPQVCLFAFPTNRIEGFPMVLAEAMFAGLGVVAFNLGGVGDAVINNETGYLIKAGNKTEFTEKMSELLENTALLEIFSENAQKKAQNEFSINAIIDKYEKVFKEALS